jgi:Tfp pilus assembly protein PilN
MRPSVVCDVVVEWAPGRVRASLPRGVEEAESVSALVPKLDGARTVGVALSRRLVFVKQAHFPPVDREAVRPVVRLQLESLFPLQAAELAFDFEGAPEPGPEGRLTSVTAARAETVREAEAELASAGLRPVWFSHAGAGAPALLAAVGRGDGIVLDRNGTETTIDVVRGGLLAHSRTAMTHNDPALLRTEVARTVAGLEGAAMPVFVCPGVAYDQPHESLASSTLAALASSPPPEEGLELPETEAKRAAKLASSRRRLASLLWLAAAAAGTIAWLDRDEAAAAARERQAEFASKAKRLDSVRELAAERKARLEQISTLVRAAKAPAQTPTDVLKYVSNATPQGTWHTGITFERGKPLQLRGTALKRDSVGALASNLAASERFRDVVIVYANDAELEGTPVVQFAMTAHVVGNLPLIEKKPTARRSR